MKCPKCGKELLIRDEKVTVDENGTPVLNQFAVCMDCKKKWNLDKQRSKKATDAKADNDVVNAAPVSGIAAHKKAVEQAKAAAKKAADPNAQPVQKKTAVSPEVNPVQKKAAVSPDVKPVQKKTAADADVRPVQKKAAISPDAKPVQKKKAANPDAKPVQKKAPADPDMKPVRKKAAVDTDEKPVRKKAPANTGAKPIENKSFFDLDEKPVKKKPAAKKQTYSNIPAKEIRDKREEEMRRGYDELLSSGEEDEPKHSRIPVIIMTVLIILALAAAGTIFFCKATGRSIPFISLSQTESQTPEDLTASAADETIYVYTVEKAELDA